VLLFDFFEDETHSDPLNLTPAIKQKLLDMSERSSFAYWPDVRFHHNAFRLVGGYEVKDSLVTLTVFLQRYGSNPSDKILVLRLSLPANSTNDVGVLADKIVKAISPSLEAARLAEKTVRGQQGHP